MSALFSTLEPSIRSIRRLDDTHEADFQHEFRRRSYQIAIVVLLIGAVAATVLLLLTCLGYGPPGPLNPQDIAFRLVLAWAAPLLLVILKSSERWYPWLVTASIALSLGQLVIVLFTNSVIHAQPLRPDELFSLQLRTVIVTLYVTTLVQLPFRFAAILALTNYAIFAVVQIVSKTQDTPYVLTRIGVIVGLGILVALLIESRERRLFMAGVEVKKTLKALEEQNVILENQKTFSKSNKLQFDRRTLRPREGSNSIWIRKRLLVRKYWHYAMRQKKTEIVDCFLFEACSMT